MMGICGCVCPPTRPGDRCNACGYVVPQDYYRQIGQYQFTPIPLTKDDVRQIIREEIERLKEAK